MRIGLKIDLKRTHVMRLCCEDDNFIELGDVGKEIIYSRSFCCAPTVLPLMRNQGSINRLIEQGRDLTSHVEVTRRSSMERRSVYGFWCGGGYGGGRSSGQTGSLKYWARNQQTYDRE